MNKKPTQVKKRIDVLDVYRGFAILGIFVVNIVIMNSTFLNQDEFAKQWTSTIDQVSNSILQLFFYTKFFPIFSLLFGLGISMQALKLLENNTLRFSFFARRMFCLFIIGALHIILLWSGDVVHLYAILGLFTISLLRVSNKILLGLAVLLLLFPFYDQLLAFFFELIQFKPENYIQEYTGETVNQIIKNGTYVQSVRLRLLEYLANTPMLFGFLAPIALSMFVLGLYLGKNKIYEKLPTFLAKIKKPVVWIALLTNVYRILFLFVLTKLDCYKIEWIRTGFIKLMVIADIIMGLFYLWLIGWLWYTTSLKKLLSPLRYAGRMALTNYIMQSFIGLLIFSSVGGRLYETLSPLETLLTAVVVFVVQVFLSKIWLTYFKYGPLEWVWRCFTYKKLLPIKKQGYKQ
ncbi:DUF418 domain-containing protein [Aquimarina brevivitae]|uniref:DUF418 domain-containing protein n=1 Tax=Aquimarina brevivitae TaxID=323412 RepID=A0A4Q7P0R1_9FLAO|nr:DUF418 domain-containing protein [Aquimarina brevivitae]RZS93386.1 uncharacterized protein EV197_1964 [Aquimarina brevivitae]